ncbi:hypothetical protein BKA82DRAFT_4358305 [Pisolithus tinctorius]|nr:hypothetical protein BKA82DRAFT_4358305 [Pisolithus tinctorius]
MADPNLEICPDFKSATFCKICKALMANLNIEPEQAIECLITAWDTNHQCRITEWEAQCQAQAEADLAKNQCREAELAACRLAAEAAENEPQDAEHKKPLMSNFTSGCPPPSVLVNRPSQYATNKLTSCEYVELWYFSPEGCSDAAHNAKTNADDAFGLSSMNDILTLRPIASVKVSQNTRADHNLSFGEFLQARVSFLHHIKAVPWTEKHINALMMFFWNLESHPQRTTSNGDTTVLTYALCIRRQWHDELKANNRHIFDISIVNNTLMSSIAFEVNNAAQKRLMHRSVPPPFSLPPNQAMTTNSLFHAHYQSTTHSIPPPSPRPLPHPPSPLTLPTPSDGVAMPH